ncbi:MAG: lipopolysaccharide export system permease protein [Oceanicoccus sp.]
MILFRYIAKEIMVSMATVSFTLLVIVMSSRFVKYLANAASGDLAPSVVFAIMMYRVPSFLVLVLPLGLFIGILLAFGRLYAESEMTVMSACGLSTSRLVGYTLVPSVFTALIVCYLSFFATPEGFNKVQKIFQDVKNSNGLETLVAGRFRVDDKTGRVSYIERLSSDHQTLENVFTAQISTRESSDRLSVVFAEKGRIELGDDRYSQYLVLDNGYEYTGKPGAKDFRIVGFDHFGQLVKQQKTEQSSYTRVEARSTAELMASDRLEDKAALQWRISLVILVPILSLIAQALSKTNHRQGRYVKMLPAFIIYIVYLVMLNAARDSIEKGVLPLEIGMWWVHGLFLALAIILLYGSNGYRYLRR